MAAEGLGFEQSNFRSGASCIKLKVQPNFNGVVVMQNFSARLTWYFLFCFLLAIKPLIISITAACPTRKELYGLDRRMNFHCSRDSGETWRQITNAYLKEVKKYASLVHATPLPETLVSEVPTANLTAVANSTGVTWGGKCNQ